MKRTITGLTIIALGIILFLANANMFNMEAIVADWWPMSLMVAGLLMLLNDSKNYIWALLVSGLGFILLMNNFNITQIDIGDIILPGVIVAIGLGMLVRSHAGTAQIDSEKQTEEITAVLSGTTSRNTADDYKGSKITTVMGGVELDVSSANIRGEAVIDMFVLMGGVELRVADNVVVKPRASVILGGIEDKTKPVDTKNAPVLYIDGNIIMGGLEIKR